MYYEKPIDISALNGKTITKIEGMEAGNDLIIFTCDDGTKYKMYHEQDCCESVDIDDVCGNVSDLIGVPVALAEESSASGECEDGDTETWTFYLLGTAKGYVNLRWYGTSNGYYSEAVTLIEVED